MLGDIVYCQYLFGQGWDYNSYYKLNTKHKVVSIRLIYELIGFGTFCILLYWNLIVLWTSEEWSNESNFNFA